MAFEIVTLFCFVQNSNNILTTSLPQELTRHHSTQDPSPRIYPGMIPHSIAFIYLSICFIVYDPSKKSNNSNILQKCLEYITNTSIVRINPGPPDNGKERPTSKSEILLWRIFAHCLECGSRIYRSLTPE